MWGTWGLQNFWKLSLRTGCGEFTSLGYGWKYFEQVVCDIVLLKPLFSFLLHVHIIKFKGLAMTFLCQENPSIIFRSKERYIETYRWKEKQNPCKFAEIMKEKKGCFFFFFFFSPLLSFFFLVSFTLGGTLSSVFNFMKSWFFYVWFVEREKIYDFWKS